MKKIKYFFIYLFVIFATLLSSCSNDQLSIGSTSISSKNSISASKIPFSDPQTLADIASNKSYVPYQIARKLAIVEMELSIKQQMNWNGTKLSEKPVVIYDGKSTPKYYEFIVSNESGKEVGTVTTCIKKEADAVVSHVLPYVRDYSSFTSKGSNYKMISGGYPSRILVGVLGKSGENPSAIVDPTTNATVSNVLSEDAQGSIQALKNLTEEQRKNIGITNIDSLITVIKEQDAIKQEYSKAYWQVMDTLASNISLTTDENIVSTVNGAKDSWTSTDTYIIPAFNNTNLKNTRWSGWCGPSALAWIYRGLYSSYKGTYLPLAGESGFDNYPYRWHTDDKHMYYYLNDDADADSDGRINSLDPDWINPQSKNADGGLYAALASAGGLYLWPAITGNQNGPVLPFGLSVALLWVTDAKYAVAPAFFTPGILEGGHTNIRYSNLPVICWVDFFSHYVVAFGSKYENWNWDVYFKIFGRKITITRGSIRTNKWLYVTDNGYETKGKGYEPFWRNDAFISLDVQYGIVRIY
jgi:hypothetical protein